MNRIAVAYGSPLLLLFLAVYGPIRLDSWPLLNRFAISAAFLTLALRSFRDVWLSRRPDGDVARHHGFLDPPISRGGMTLAWAWVFLPLIPNPLAAVAGIASGVGALGIRYERWRRGRVEHES